LLGFVVQGADKETGQGRGVVLLWHGPFRWLVLNERTKFNSLYPHEDGFRRRGLEELPVDSSEGFRSDRKMALPRTGWITMVV
jgi:hypothetical protein